MLLCPDPKPDKKVCRLGVSPLPKPVHGGCWCGGRRLCLNERERVCLLVVRVRLHILVLLLLEGVHHLAEVLRYQHEPALISLIDLLVANSRKNLRKIRSRFYLKFHLL